jgi:hypothetical protein
MAIVWLPGPRLVLQGDLFYSDAIERFPPPARIPIMKWFAAWLERAGLSPTAIWGTHDERPATVEHLAKLADVEG